GLASYGPSSATVFWHVQHVQTARTPRPCLCTQHTNPPPGWERRIRVVATPPATPRTSHTSGAGHQPGPEKLRRKTPHIASAPPADNLSGVSGSAMALGRVVGACPRTIYMRRRSGGGTP